MSDDLVALIARELQLVPVAATDASLLAAGFAANNERIERVSRSLLQMEDHPGTFDPWARTFAPVET